MASRDHITELGEKSTPRELNINNPNAGFNADVSKAEMDISQLVQKTKEIQILHHDILNLKATSPQELKTKKDKADKMTQDARDQIKKIDTKVRALNQDKNDDLAITKIRQSAARAVFESFQKAVSGFQEMQELCKENYRAQVRRQAQALRHDSSEISETQLDDMINKGTSTFQLQEGQ